MIREYTLYITPRNEEIEGKSLPTSLYKNYTGLVETLATEKPSHIPEPVGLVGTISVEDRIATASF